MSDSHSIWHTPDICIIGSGAAGSFLAHSLKETGLSVLILETGTLSPDSDIDGFIEKLNVGKQNYLNYGFSRQVGGSTNLWAGRVAPLEEIDFKAKSFVPDSGWPININDLIPFYSRASKIMGLPPYEYFQTRQNSSNNKRIKKLIDAVLSTSLEIKNFIWSSPPFNTRKTILKDITDSRHHQIKLYDGCHVTQLFENKEQSKILSVEYIDKSGNINTISPKNTVLAAGGVENVRILLNSTQGNKCGVANKHDNVGRYFSTHPKADMGVLLLNKSISLKGPLFVDTQEDTLSIRQGIGVNQTAQENKELLNHYVQLTPMLEYTASTFFEKIKDSSVLNSPLINKSKVMKGVLPGIGLLIYELIGRIAGLQPKSSKFILRAFLDQFPNKEHRVKLSDTLDKHGHPKVEIDWTLTDQDKQSVMKFFNYIDHSLREQKIGHIEYSKLTDLSEWPIIAIHSHFMGTTRMGNRPQNSVVDKNCQVHGYKNLFITGPSVFPTYGYANPVYTIAALSLRLGDFLARSCRQSS